MPARAHIEWTSFGDLRKLLYNRETEEYLWK